MKKSKSEALAKKAKKSAFKEIKDKLTNQLSEVAGKLGKDSKKIRQIIEKESKKLAKKIVKKLKIQSPYSAYDSPKASVIKPEVGKKEIQPVFNSTVSESRPPVRSSRKKIAGTGIKTKTSQKASELRKRKVKDPIA